MKTQVGISDSPAARALIRAGQLQVDFLEAHGPYLEEARAELPDFNILLHNSLYQWSLADPQALQTRDAGAITLRRLALARSPWYSVHLGFSAVELAFEDEAMQARSPVLDARTIFERTCKTVTELQSLLGVPLLLENMDYNPTGAYDTICDPAFICDVLEATGASLLFDLAHARVSAAGLGIPLETYLLQLPLQHTRQIHLNRPGWRANRLVDSHQALEDEDYQLLAEVLKRCQPPWAVTLEYHHDPALIAPQIERLKKIAAQA